MKRIAYLKISKNGNEYFTIGKRTYVIVDRPKDEIGQNNNYSEKVILEVSKKGG